MPGAFTTISIKDAVGATLPMRVWDDSGTGAGPMTPVHILNDGAAEYETVAASQTAQTLGRLAPPAITSPAFWSRPLPRRQAT